MTGLKPHLNEAIKRLVTLQDKLTQDDIDRFYAAYFSNDRLVAQTERAGSGLAVEMDEVMGLIEAAVGTTARYGESLEAISGEIAAPIGRNRLHDVVGSLVEATRVAAESNKLLETRLKDSRGEIDGLRRMLEEVRQESLTDPLTGISNRKHFETTLTESVARAQAERAPLTLIVIDIDEFKRFNDHYGHLTGDQVLRLVSAAMRENMAPESTLARFGGEEFGMILPRTERQAAFECAEKIRLNVMGRELLKRSTGESLGRVTVSLGIAVLTPSDTTMSLPGTRRLVHVQGEADRAESNVVDDGVAMSEAS